MIKGEGAPKILCDHTDWQRIAQTDMDKCKCGKVRYRQYSISFEPVEPLRGVQTRERDLE